MSGRVRLILLETALPVALIVIWYVASAAHPTLYFPSLKDIASAFRANWLFGRVGSDLLPSLGRLTLGYVLACLIGMAGGFVLGSSHIARRLAGPIVGFFRSLPSAALLPVAIQLFGVGDSMKISLIVFICVWPVLLNTTNGIDETDATLIQTARSYSVRGWRRVTWLVVPAAAPRIFAGMRTSLAMAIILMIISEMSASTSGVGYFISQAQNTFAITDMWSGIVLLGLLGYVLNLLFTLVERRVLRWYFASKAGVSKE